MRVELLCFFPIFLPLHAGNEVYGGPKTSIEIYPFISRLRIGRNTCTGSLLKKNLIITAHHCFFDKHGNFMSHGTATFYDSDKKKEEKGEFTRNIKHVKSYKNSDLALAKLTSSVKGIKPVKLNRKKFMTGSSMRTVGYGWHAPNGSTPDPHDGHLREIILKISFVNETYIGTRLGKNNEGPCAGDSGAPLLVLANQQWSVLATLFGFGFDCRDSTIDPQHPHDVWSRVTVIKPSHLHQWG